MQARANGIPTGLCCQRLSVGDEGAPYCLHGLNAVYLSEFAPSRARGILKPALEVLAGVPTVVYGFFALVVVTPLLQRFVSGLSAFNSLSAGIVMGVMIVPLVSSLSEDAMSSVPDSLREAAVALGAPAWKMIIFISYRAARAGIVTGILLAVARISGETAPLLFTALNNQFWSLNLNAAMANLPAVSSSADLSDRFGLLGIFSFRANGVATPFQATGLDIGLIMGAQMEARTIEIR